MSYAKLLLDHSRLDTIYISSLLSIGYGLLEERPGSETDRTLGEEGKSCDTICQPARPENGITAHSIPNHFGNAFLQFGRVRGRNGMHDSVDVVLLGVMPERPVAHFEQLRRARAYAITSFDGRYDVGPFQLLDVLLQVESALG